MTSTGQQPPVPAPTENWAWAQPARPTRLVETEPLEYHRLLRGVTGYRWWKPLLMAVLALFFFLLASFVVGLGWLAALVVQDPSLLQLDPLQLADELTGRLVLDTQSPLSIVMGLLSVIVMIPSVWLAMIIMGMRPWGRVWSVALKIRWRLLFVSTGVAVGAVIVMNAAGLLLELLFDPALLDPAASGGEAPAIDVRAAVLSMLFVLLLMPLQATAEEVMFRGMLVQALGAWNRSPWLYLSVGAGYVIVGASIFLGSSREHFTNFVIVSAVFAMLAGAASLVSKSPFLPIVVPSLAFALMHIYTLWGMIAVGLMGLVAAWLTWRTGGLEAAIAIHVVNNLVAFAFMASGSGGTTAQTADAGGGPGAALGQLLGLLLYAWLVAIVFRRGRYGRTRIDLVREPVPAGEVRGA